MAGYPCGVGVMGMFKHLEGQVAVIVEGGVYKPVDIYTRDGYLYAKTGAGFVRLYADGSTTKAKCRLDTLHFDGALFRDALGRMCSQPVNGAAPIGGPERLRIASGA